MGLEKISIWPVLNLPLQAYHLMSKNWELVHLHRALILPIDTLMADQSCSSDHVRRHSITDEENNIFRLLLLLEGSDEPVCYRLRAIVIVKCRHVLARFVESNSSVGFRGHADNRGGVGILCKEVLVPGEVPAFKCRLGNLEECRSRLGRSANF